MLTHPDTRPATIAPDVTNLVIVIAQTGDEWSTTGELVDIGNPGYQNLLKSPCSLTSHQDLSKLA
ncbi:hypothetical protein [Amycolatopsis sp. cmx-11-12]|uniref:hypothetical protein n=1 Tax=Amycolatopsis sp. cmx-11-12 TaxID=2785795 RepID=UPI0039173299